MTNPSSGTLLRVARSRAGLTQRELARRAGTTQSVISAYEADRRQPALITLAALVERPGWSSRSAYGPPTPGSTDALVFDAVRIRLLEIGEAVKALPEHPLAVEPSIPWTQIARMRDRLAHRYFETTHAVVTATIDNDLDDLLGAVKRLIDHIEDASQA